MIIIIGKEDRELFAELRKQSGKFNTYEYREDPQDWIVKTGCLLYDLFRKVKTDK